MSSDFLCAEDEEPIKQDLHRLTKRQYKNTLRDLLQGLPTPLSDKIFTDLISPETPSDGGISFDRTDNRFSVVHASGYFNTAINIARFLASDPKRAEGFVSYYIKLSQGQCLFQGIDSISNQCIHIYFTNLGLRVFRRPLLVDEIVPFVDEFNRYTSKLEGFENSLIRILMNPSFLFLEQFRGNLSLDSKSIILNDYEIANRLSYQFWDSMPDESLFEAARKKQLSDPDSRGKVVETVFNNPRTKETFRNFFYQWLLLDKVPSFLQTDLPEFKYLAQNINFDENLRLAMIEEVLELTNYVVEQPDGQFKDLFLNNISFTRNQELLKVYGLNQPAPFNTTPTNAVRFPAKERAGILSRAALLVSGTAYENPIHRGIHILRDFMCSAPPPPDTSDLPDDALAPPEPNPNLTTRQRFAEKTKPSQCIGCHRSINPIGFALNGFNGLGMYRTQEAIFDHSGQFMKNLAISSEVDMKPFFGRTKRVDNAYQFSRIIANNMDTQKCFTRKYFEFSFGFSSEPYKRSSCVMSALRGTIGRQESLQSFFKKIVADPSFTQRKFDPIEDEDNEIE